MPSREWVVVAAGAGLPTMPRRPDPVADDEWTEVLGRLKAERLTGLALVAASSGLLPLTEDQRDELDDSHVQAMGIALQIEQHLVHIIGLLGEHAIPVRVLKGSAVAHLDYPDPSLRAFGDADVLLRAADIDTGLAVLASAGYRRASPAARSGFDRRFGKGTFLVAEDGHEIDVHRTFAMGPYGYTVTPGDLWVGGDDFTLGDRTITALPADLRLLHACFHAVVGNPFDRALPYRDVAEMLLYGEIDQDRVLETAARWRARAVVARACVTSWDVLGIDVEPSLVTWARDHLPDPAELRMMRVYTAHTSYAAKSLASLRVMTWPDRVAFVRLLARSDRDFTRGRTRADWLWNGARRALRDR